MCSQETSLRSAITGSVEEVGRYIEITAQDLEALRRLKPRAAPLIPRLAGKVASLLLGDPQARDALERSGVTEESLRSLFEGWLHTLFDGGYDEEHAVMLARIGLTHVRVPTAGRLIVSVMGAFHVELLRLASTPRESEALAKAFYWNLAVISLVYEKVRESICSYFMRDNRRLAERLIDLFSREIYEELGDPATRK